MQTPSKLGAGRGRASPPAGPLRARAGIPAAPARCARRPDPCAASHAGPPQARIPHHRCCWLACPCGCAFGSSSCCACPPAHTFGRCHAGLGSVYHEQRLCKFRGYAVQLLNCTSRGTCSPCFLFLDCLACFSLSCLLRLLLDFLLRLLLFLWAASSLSASFKALMEASAPSKLP